MMNKTDDDLIPLADASADFGFARGSLKAAGLRGELAMYKIGRQYYTSPNAVREWVALKCRVKAKAPVSGLIRDESNGLSATDRISSARDALLSRLS